MQPPAASSVGIFCCGVSSQLLEQAARQGAVPLPVQRVCELEQAEAVPQSAPAAGPNPRRCAAWPSAIACRSGDQGRHPAPGLLPCG